MVDELGCGCEVPPVVVSMTGAHPEKRTWIEGEPVIRIGSKGIPG
jgi:hypothetical protein